MKIAIVTDFLLKMGGAERVVERLAALYPDAPIYTLLYDEEKCGKVFPAARVRTSFLQKLPLFLRKRYKFLFPLMPYAIEGIDLMNYDLILSSSSAYAHGVLTHSSAVHISYCHSPMRYIWDYSHRYLDEQKSGFLGKFVAKRMLHNVRIWDQIAADRPDYYVANSVHVQKRIEKYFRLPAKVIYPPVDVERFEVSVEKEDYFLIISTLTPYKKIDLAVNLFNKTQKRLVVIGDGPEIDFLRRIAGPTVEILGRKSDEECAQYLAKCRGYLQVNEEDFGLSPIEAMACGKPVLAYGVGGILESVIPGKTGEFFYEQTLESMEDGLGRFIVNETYFKPQEIRKQAEHFSTQQFLKKFQMFVEQKRGV